MSDLFNKADPDKLNRILMHIKSAVQLAQEVMDEAGTDNDLLLTEVFRQVGSETAGGVFVIALGEIDNLNNLAHMPLANIVAMAHAEGDDLGEGLGWETGEVM